MPTYRKTLSVSFFNRFWYQIIRDLKMPAVDAKSIANLDEIKRDLTKSKQEFGEANTNPKDPIGTTNPHLSALKQTTGVAKYLDDIPKLEGELYAGCVLSTKAHAYIKNIKLDKALALNGVHRFISHKDVPKHNKFGVITKDEEFFASNEVLFLGQLIGLVIADNKQIAKKAASLVEVEYEILDEILTIEDAIENNSFYNGFERSIKKGVIDDATFKIEPSLEGKEFAFEGVCRLGGQEHFYLETHGVLAIPKGEDNEMEVYSSTQNPTEAQSEIAMALGIPQNRVTCKVKRLGGGFGGKVN